MRLGLGLSLSSGNSPATAGTRIVGYQDSSFKRNAVSELYRDKFSQCEWQDAGYVSSYGVNADGLGGNMTYDGTINEIKPGDAHVKLMLKNYWGDVAAAGAPVVYEIRYPAGMTLVWNILDTKTVTAPTTVGMPAGIQAVYLTVNNAYDTPKKTTEMQFSGFPTARPSGPLNLRPTIIRVGDTDTNFIASPLVVASYNALGSNCLRTMDMRGVKGNFINYDWGDIYQGQGPNIPFFVDLCNRTNQDLWLNMYFWQTDAAMTAEFTYIAQHLNSNLNCYVEWGNELWNNGESLWEEGAIQGVLAGFGTSATSTGATAITVTPGTTQYRASGNFATVSTVDRTPTRSFLTGDTVVGNLAGVGVVLIKALQNITANDTAAAIPKPAVDTAYWSILVDSNASGKASPRYLSYRSANCGAKAKAAFTAAGADPSRVRTVAAWQSSASVLGSGSASNIFAFDNNGPNLVFTHHAVAPYYGGGQGGFKLGNYASGTGTEQGPWTATARSTFNANYPTDPNPTGLTGSMTTIVNTYFDPLVAAAAINATCGVFEQRQTEIGTYCSNNSLPAGSITMAVYEFGPHNNIQDGAWPVSATWQALQNAIQADPRTAALFPSYIARIRAAAVGPICWYSRFGDLPWNIQTNELDRTSPTFAALAAIRG